MLHQLLSRNRDEIVMRCERKLRARHPDRPADELLHTIPGFIDELIKAERREAGLPESTPLPRHSEHARAHGEQRFHRGYPIDDLALDFGTISDVIGELAIEQHFALDPRSYRLLNECIDNAIAQSIHEYFELNRASEEKGVAAWVGSLGHELRNSVASALMAFTVIRTGQVGVESRTAHVLERSLHRIETLVAQTLAAVQLKSGQQLECKPVMLRELVDDIIAGTLHERDIVIENEVEPDVTVKADLRLLDSALTNLVQNAVKFTRTAGHVAVRATASDRGTTIDVVDECGGLAENPEQLFEVFVQRGDKTRGVGLGLAITRQAIEAHGGTVSARDLSPRGCAFSVWLPP